MGTKKILSVPLHISGTIHHMIVIYDANVSNDDISRCFFSILNWFSGLSRGLKGKKWPKMTKIYVCHTWYFRNHIIWSSFMVHMYVWKDNISRHFFSFFFKILIFRIIRHRWTQTCFDTIWPVWAPKKICPNNISSTFLRSGFSNFSTF